MGEDGEGVGAEGCGDLAAGRGADPGKQAGAEEGRDPVRARGEDDAQGLDLELPAETMVIGPVAPGLDAESHAHGLEPAPPRLRCALHLDTNDTPSAVLLVDDGAHAPVPVLERRGRRERTRVGGHGDAVARLSERATWVVTSPRRHAGRPRFPCSPATMARSIIVRGSIVIAAIGSILGGSDDDD